MKKVLVLMSTYNGLKFIEDQIISILNQKGVYVDILIRDDGSSDGTKEYLQSLTNDRITVISGTNIGFAESFMTLIYESYNYEYDYYAFSDQDDVWLSDKLVTAVSMLEEIVDKNALNLYYSSFTLVNENLIPLQERPLVSGKVKPHIFNKEEIKPLLLIRYFMLGCTMVFNRKTVEFINLYRPKMKLQMHDMWLGQTCGYFGNIVFDEQSHFLYRQHGNNVSGVSSSLITRLNRFFKSFKTYERRHFRELGAKNFLMTYNGLLTEEDKQLVSIVADYRNSLSNRIRFLLTKKINMGSIISDTMIKLRIIFGIA